VEPTFPRLHLVTGVRPLETVRAAAPGELAVRVRVEDAVTDREAGAYGVAVVGAIARDPERATAESRKALA
jgi:hypothetical protein